MSAGELTSGADNSAKPEQPNRYEGTSMSLGNYTTRRSQLTGIIAEYETDPAMELYPDWRDDQLGSFRKELSHLQSAFPEHEEALYAELAEVPYATWKALADICFSDIKAGDASGDESQRDEAQRQLDELKRRGASSGYWSKYKSERFPGR